MTGLLLTAALLFPSATSAEVLDAIDDICGDTWCEGDFSYAFKRVALDPRTDTTRVWFTMGAPDSIDLDHGARIRGQRFDVLCTVQGYSTRAELLESDGRLNWDFYLALGACIESLEARLGRVSRAP